MRLFRRIFALKSGFVSPKMTGAHNLWVPGSDHVRDRLLPQSCALLMGERHRRSPNLFKEPFKDDIERFFAMLRFPSREKLKALLLE
jgi:hypothetical protein